MCSAERHNHNYHASSERPVRNGELARMCDACQLVGPPSRPLDLTCCSYGRVRIRALPRRPAARAEQRAQAASKRPSGCPSSGAPGRLPRRRPLATRNKCPPSLLTRLSRPTAAAAQPLSRPWVSPGRRGQTGQGRASGDRRALGSARLG